MNKITLAAFTLLFAFSGITMAQTEEKAPNIEEIKQQFLQNLDKSVAMKNQIHDKELAILGQLLSCIQTMKNETDFKNCDTAANEAFKKMALELEKARLESQKKALANQEKRLNEEMKGKK